MFWRELDVVLWNTNWMHVLSAAGWEMVNSEKCIEHQTKGWHSAEFQLLLLLLLLSRFSRVWLCATPQTAAHQAPPSLGFSRQEHWSGLSFPSPIHESEKWKWSNSVVYDSSRLHGLQPTRLPCPWDFPGKSTGVGCHCLLQHKLTKIAKIKKMCDNKDMKHMKLSQIAERSVNSTTTLDN